MIHLLFLIIIKALSGARNGYHYTGDKLLRNLFNTAVILMLFLYAMIINKISPNLFYIIIPIAALYLYAEFGFNKYLHWWESIVANLIYFVMIVYGCDLLMLPMTGLLTNIFFKGTMNLVIGRKFIERVDGTDDDSGNTLGFPTRWGTLRRPRIGNGYISAAIGVILFLIWLIINKFYPIDYQLVISFFE